MLPKELRANTIKNDIYIKNMVELYVENGDPDSIVSLLNDLVNRRGDDLFEAKSKEMEKDRVKEMLTWKNYIETLNEKMYAIEKEIEQNKRDIKRIEKQLDL